MAIAPFTATTPRTVSGQSMNRFVDGSGNACLVRVHIPAMHTTNFPVERNMMQYRATAAR